MPDVDSSRDRRAREGPGAAGPYDSDEDARAYVTWRKRSLARRLSKRFEIWRVRRLAGHAGRVLDMPCGSGRFDAFVSCDRAHGMVRLARAAGGRAVRADAFALPFAADAFDTALCVRFLHHFDAEERQAALRGLARVARRAVVTYFGDRGFKARRRAAKGTGRTRRGIPATTFAGDCAAAGWSVARDAAVFPGWSEQRVAQLVRQ